MRFCQRVLHTRVPQILEVVTIVLLTVTASGCWDSLSVDKRAFVTAVGFDSAVDDHGNEEVKVTILMPNIGGPTVNGGRGGDSSGQGKSSSPVVTIDDTGRYAEEAFASLRARLGAVLDISTIQFVVAGDSVRPQDLVPGLSTVIFAPSVPMTPFVVASQGKAEDIIKAEMIQGKTVTDFLEILEGESRQTLGQVRFPQVWEVLSVLQNRTGDITLPVVRYLEQEKRIEAVGMAAFDGAKIAGVFTGDSAMLINAIARGKSPGGVINFKSQGREFAARVVALDVRKQVEIPQGRRIPQSPKQDQLPRFAIKVRVAARLQDSGNYRMSNPSKSGFAELETAIERDFESTLNNVAGELKTMGSDAFRLYRDIRIKMPSVSFEQFKEVYHLIPIEFQVSVRLTRVGLLK